jgi:UDP-N-acetylenolpyruvoylglucosamine reductase
MNDSLCVVEPADANVVDVEYLAELVADEIEDRLEIELRR